MDLGPVKQRAVLATLLLAANRPVLPSRIIDAVWGDEPPENGTNVVQKYVAGLRRVLKPDRAPRSAGRLLTLVATFGGALMVDSSSDEITSGTDGLGVILVIASALVCAVHAAVLVPRRTRQAAAPDLRRQFARQLATDHPQIARQLGIGRPDLPNQFEDGGLIDVNDAPESVLRTLPGASAQQAALIVADRTFRGPFRSLAELSARGLFPWPIPPAVAERLLIIVVQDTVDEGRR